MADRDTIIAAHDAWRNAHRAYRDEVASMWFGTWKAELLPDATRSL
jgi:hypothetical protein